jgi:hypothetical protein
MAEGRETSIRRVLQLRFMLPTADPAALVAFIDATKPYYELFGGHHTRLLQNVDRPTQFTQILDYDVNAALETSRQQVAGDPRLQVLLQSWRAIFPSMEIDVFRDVGGRGDAVKETRDR